MRGDRYRAFTNALAVDPRPLVIEHLEDLEGKPRTREEQSRGVVLDSELLTLEYLAAPTSVAAEPR
jgi:hypothetical protein